MGIYRRFHKRNRPSVFGAVSDLGVIAGSLPSLSTLACLVLILISGATVRIAHGQHYLGMMPFAEDSLTSISDPYLTRYWYDGQHYLDCGDETNYWGSHGALWLTYVETDEGGSQRICANNFAFSYQHEIEISPLSIIAESQPQTSLKAPIIENYLGRPVAIWLEEDPSRTDLLYSTFAESVWSTPERITDDSYPESSPVFITVEGEPEDQGDGPFNCLFWVRDDRICSAELDENWHWLEQETIHMSQRPLGRLVPRLTTTCDLWLLFDEIHEPDSVYVKVLIRDLDTHSWTGPYTLVRLIGEASQANLELCYGCAYWDGDLILSWVENEVFKNALVTRTDDTIGFLPEWNDWVLDGYDSFDYVSNTLLAEEGCIVAPLAHYLYALGSSEGDRVLMHNDGGYPATDIEITTTDNSVSALTLSGVNDFHSVGAWTEHDGRQSDLFVAFFWFLVGLAEDGQQSFEQPLYLYPGSPNPLSHSVTITYALTRALNIDLALYDSSGRRMKQIVSGWHGKGTYQIAVSACDIPQGTYYCILFSDQGRMTRRLIVNR